MHVHYYHISFDNLLLSHIITIIINPWAAAFEIYIRADPKCVSFMFMVIHQG